MNSKRLCAIAPCTVFILFSLSALAQPDRCEGRPHFAEGADLGYYLWEEGGKWHLRWTTQGRQRHFTGTVVAEGGNLKSLKRIDVESERRVVYPGRAPRVVVGRGGRARVKRGRRPVVVEKTQDKIEKDGDNRIVFSSKTTDDIDGFDFETGKKVTALRITLEIDGKRAPRQLEIGRHNWSPNAFPLVVPIE